MTIVWRERFLAFAIHFLVTLALAACAAALIFIVWFPDPFQTMVGGTELFELVVLCDLVLGPLISLVIYDSTKARWQLVMDYSIIGAIQLAAMIYGVYIVAGTRPVYVAFNQDRLEVVTARDIDASGARGRARSGLRGSAAGRPALRRGPGAPGRPDRTPCSSR